MDIVTTSKKLIDRRLKRLNKKLVEVNRGLRDEEDVYLQTQTAVEVAISDKDKNLDRILEQMAQIKMIIERDCRIKSLIKSCIDEKKSVDQLRQYVAKFGLDMDRSRQELADAHTRERARFQTQQMKSIQDDYLRHQEILRQRKKEILALKKETENEESNRELYLADVEKKMERDLQNRQQLNSSSSLAMIGGGGGAFDEVHNPNHIELTSIDEYAPYGTAPHSRLGANQSGRGRGGSTRGRKRKQP